MLRGGKSMKHKEDFDKERFDHVHTSYQSVTTEVTDDNEQRVILTDVQSEDPAKSKKFVPEYHSQLKSRIVEMPEEIYQASGIKILGKRIKSLIFTTDVAIIKNCNAQSVIAVYPFTPQLTIMQSIVDVSSIPVFLGVGGGTTTGQRSVDLAFMAEQMGAYGVVVNAPMKDDVIADMNRRIDIPLIATVGSFNDDYISKLNAGADMLNVSAASNTVALVREIRQAVGPSVPIIATGGPTGESITATIEAGANAITYTPPTSAEIFAEVMTKYRSVSTDD